MLTWIGCTACLQRSPGAVPGDLIRFMRPFGLEFWRVGYGVWPSIVSPFRGGAPLKVNDGACPENQTPQAAISLDQ